MTFPLFLIYITPLPASITVTLHSVPAVGINSVLVLNIALTSDPIPTPIPTPIPIPALPTISIIPIISYFFKM